MNAYLAPLRTMSERKSYVAKDAETNGTDSWPGGSIPCR